MIASSYSRMKDSDCPFRFNALHIERTYKEPQTEPMLIGSAVHEAVAEYMRHCLKQGVISDHDFLTSPTWPEEVRSYLSRLSESPHALAPVGAEWVAVEARMSFDKDLQPILMQNENDAWFAPNTAFRVIADLAYAMDGTLYITDWKTGYGASMDPLQTEIYGCLVSTYYLAKLNPKEAPESVSTIIVNLATGKTSTDTWTLDKAPSARETILKHLETVNSWTEYPAVACGACKWCSVPGCPIRSEALTALVSEKPTITIPSEITTHHQAEQAVLFLLFAEQVTDRVQELLRGYVENNGPVSAGGKIAELRANEPWKCTDFQKLCRTLLAYGVESKTIWEYASLSESALEKIVKKAGIREKLPLLLAMGERRQYKPRFGLYNDSLQK